MVTLTQGFLASVIQGTHESNPLYMMPTLQVLSFKKMEQPAGSTAAASSDKYRFMLSDGEYFSQALLTSQQNTICASGEMTKNGIIRVKKFIVNVIKEKKLILMLDVEVLFAFDDGMEKIG